MLATAIQWGEGPELEKLLGYCLPLHVAIPFLVSGDLGHIVVEHFSVRRMIVPEPADLLGNFVGRAGSADFIETLDLRQKSKETRTRGYDRQ